MSIKSILTIFSGDAREHSALESAFLLSKTHNARVTCLHISPDPEYISHLGVGITGTARETMMADVEAVNTEQYHKAKKIFNEIAGVFNINTVSGKVKAEVHSAVFEHLTGEVDKIVAAKARLADLVIMGRSISNTNVDYSNAINVALFQSGRPVLLAPGHNPHSIAQNIVLAWNGSIQSTRILFAAMPLVRKAKSVHIIAVSEEPTNGEITLKEVSSYLSLHDVACHEHVIEKKGLSVGEAITQKCQALDTDLLVMGAYTHNRLRQKILGGVTSHVMQDGQLPVLMAH